MPVNVGFAQACNAGAKAAKGEILLFLNSDTIAHPNWQQPLLDAFESGVGIVGPKLVFPVSYWCPACRVYQCCEVEDNGQIICQQCGGVCVAVETIQSAGGWFDAGKGPYHRNLGWRADDPIVNVNEDVSWTTGAALAVRKDVFVAAGGFDPEYHKGYFEDVALCCAVRKAGLRVRYVPESVFTHLVAQSTSTNGSDQERQQSFYANSRRFHMQWDEWIVPDTMSARYVNY
jgi:GT2 family glycosyltransferase